MKRQAARGFLAPGWALDLALKQMIQRNELVGRLRAQMGLGPDGVYPLHQMPIEL